MAERRSSWRVLRRGFGLLRRAVREQPRIFTVSAAGSCVYGIMTIGTAYVLGTLTNNLVLPAFASGHTTAGALAGAAALLLGIGVIRAAGIVARRMGAGVMQYRLQAEYRRRVTRAYLRLPLSWHQAHPTGELLSNANADVEAAWWPIAPFPMAVGVVVMVIGALIFLVSTDPVLALVGCVVFPGVTILNVIYSRRLAPLMARAQQLRAEVSGVAHESFDGALVVKAMGQEAAETARFARVAEALRDAMVRVGRVRGMFDPAMEALPTLGVLLVLLVGIQRVDAGQIIAGDLVRVTYLFTLLAFPIRAIGWLLGELPRAVVGYDRVEAVLTATGAMQYGTRRLQPEPSGGEAPAADTDPAALAGVAAPAVRVDLDRLSYSYPDAVGRAAPAVRDVTLEVTPGRTIAIVGPTGAGKSTLAALLVRLVDPSTGRVLLDGVDVRLLDDKGVAGAVALVPQETFLFDDTVRGNVTLGADYDDRQVWAALRAAQAEQFVRALPGALDAGLGERGATLSGGQRQRIALARALIRQPRLLVLDDATSSVDPHVEAAILARLRAFAGHATVVMVAYRNATIALADEVVYLEAGRIVATGGHEALLAEIAGYRNLVTAYERRAARVRASARAASPADTPAAAGLPGLDMSIERVDAGLAEAAAVASPEPGADEPGSAA